jgi:hypothetical protein
VRLSYSNLKDALDNIGDDEDYYIAHATDRGSSSNKQTNTEGHKDNKDNNNPKTLEEWSKVVARRTNNLPEFKRRE